MDKVTPDDFEQSVQDFMKHFGMTREKAEIAVRETDAGGDVIDLPAPSDSVQKSQEG